MKPALIFADQPTSRLDPVIQQEVFDLLVTHNEDIVHSVAGRRIRLGQR